MRCPVQLPVDLQARVVAVFAEAELRLRNVIRERVHRSAYELSFIFVLDVMPAFVAGGCAAVEQNHWTLDQFLHEEVEKFACAVISEVDDYLYPATLINPSTVRDRKWKLWQQIQRTEQWEEICLKPLAKFAKTFVAADPQGHRVLLGQFLHATGQEEGAGIASIAQGAGLTDRSVRAWRDGDTTQTGAPADRVIRNYIKSVLTSKKIQKHQ
ncbi:MAG TPA: hypothetical protein VH640_10060 [Bryobacteraceae bacterium]|jgi:hypothetical protein